MNREKRAKIRDRIVARYPKFSDADKLCCLMAAYGNCTDENYEEKVIAQIEHEIALNKKVSARLRSKALRP